jgi:predicted neutral ceramidase superfamily lipid hydrolase
VDNEAIVRKWYSKLFKLPSISRALAYNLMIVLLVSALRSIFSLHNLPLNILRYFLGVCIYILLIYLTIGFKNSLVGFRRSLGVALFSQAIMAPIELIMYWSEAYGVMYSCSAGVIMIVSFTVSSKARSIISLIAPIAGALIVQMDLTHIKIHTYTAAASILISFIYISIVGFYGLRMDASPFRLVKGFLSAWTINNPQVIENILSEKASRDTVDTTIFKISGLSKEVVLINPSIHFGPFKDVGRSKLPYYLEEELGDSYRVMVFHTPCSHDRNIVKSRIAKNIALKLTSAVKNREDYEEISLQKIHRIFKDSWSLFTLRFNNGLLVFIHNHVFGNDDLPYILQKIAETCRERLNLKFIQVIDSHSFKGLENINVEALASGINEAANINSSKAVRVMAGYGEAEINGYCRGICRNMVKALTLRIDDEVYLIIYIYGNNMDGKYREKLIKTIKEEFKVSDIEVITPDDHSCAATSIESPYYIVRECHYLTEAVRKAAEKSIKNTSIVKIEFKKVSISNVELMGGYVWKLLKALEEIGGKAFKLLFTSIILTYISTYIISYLLAKG